MSALGTMFSIVNRTSTALAKVRWHLYESAASGLDDDRVEVLKHPARTLVKRPNPFTSWQPYAEGSQQHVDLAGESFWCVSRAGGDKGLPLEMWYLRPDRVEPQPSQENYLAGYLYRSPGGESVPLETANVIHLKMPNPLDPYRGMSPVPSLMATLGNMQAAIRWNEAFFRNSAEPGGIIEVEGRLGDDEFEELRDRWREQHQGLDQAHRVAILERGKFIERKITQRDMEWVNGLNLSRELVREAYGMPKFLLGGDEGSINRATADAALVMMGEFLTVPRADRVKDALNTQLLPMYGTLGEGYEFDYDSPIPGDGAAENASLTTRVTAAKTLIDAGADPAEVCEYLELPEFTFKKPTPPKPPALPPVPPPVPGDPEEGMGEDTGEPAAADSPDNWVSLFVRPRAAADDPSGVVDLEKTRQAWDSAFARLGTRWQGVVDAQVRALLGAVHDALSSGDLGALAAYGTPEDLLGTHVLEDAMVALSGDSADLVVGEARRQGQDITAGAPDHGMLRSMATLAAGVLGRQLALAGMREAVRTWQTQGADVRAITAQVETVVRGAPTGGALPMLSGLLSRAQSAGRYATMVAAPVAKYYATERYDKSTCGPCAKIDGKELPTLNAAMTAYGSGPYLYCEGLWRCRGTYVAVWPEGTS